MNVREDGRQAGQADIMGEQIELWNSPPGFSFGGKLNISQSDISRVAKVEMLTIEKMKTLGATLPNPGPNPQGNPLPLAETTDTNERVDKQASHLAMMPLRNCISIN
jgi:hypothetical protein